MARDHALPQAKELKNVQQNLILLPAKMQTGAGQNRSHLPDAGFIA